MSYGVSILLSPPEKTLTFGGDVTTWSNRLQDILGKGLEKGLVDNQDMNSMLHAMLWRGLRQELKDISGHKHDKDGSMSAIFTS
jgi:hypothetical protein